MLIFGKSDTGFLFSCKVIKFTRVLQWTIVRINDLTLVIGTNVSYSLGWKVEVNFSVIII
uniref:Uncharacterized protein n=1 Tax=Octopus bimaculoides TaxID=37653 RepID=A0A0L8H0W9_OCTBM